MTYKIRQRWQLLKNDLGDLECLVKISTPFIPLNTARWNRTLPVCRSLPGYVAELGRGAVFAALFDFPCVPEISGPQPGNVKKAGNVIFWR